MGPAKPRILVVDDYPQVLSFIRIGLGSRGYEVEVQDSGRGALESVRLQAPDAILLDIRMPDMDGFEVIRQLSEFSNSPVIAYSATPEFAAQALETGAVTFIPKPFDMDMLLQTIDQVVSGQA